MLLHSWDLGFGLAISRFCELYLDITSIRVRTRLYIVMAVLSRRRLLLHVYFLGNYKLNDKEEKKLTIADFERAVKGILLSIPGRKAKYENRKPTKEESEKKLRIDVVQ